MRISLLFRLSTIKLLLVLAGCASQLVTICPVLANTTSINSASQADASLPLKPALALTQSQSPSPASATPSQQSAQNDPSGQAESDATHDVNKTLDVGKLRLHSAVHKYSFEPVRLEIEFDEPITLEQALRYAVDNNLPIKISRENLYYQRYVLFSNMANALPNFAMSYNLTKTRIFNEDASSLARVFLPRVSYPVFQGGSVVYSILGQYCRERGWRHAYFASINDAMLDVY